MGKKCISAGVLFLTMLAVLLDTKVALQGARDGIALCLHTVIPSLFPFLLLCGLLSTIVNDLPVPFFGFFCKLGKIPPHGISLLGIGLLGGYPAGAQVVAQAYQAGLLSKKDGEKLLVLCNHTGPAFIFGFGATVFAGSLFCLLIWLIQLLSVVFLIIILAKTKNSQDTPWMPMRKRLKNPMAAAVDAMAQICGWVILFRVLLAYLEHWFLWCAPMEVHTLLCGILEMTNGCSMLTLLPLQGQRLLLMAVMTSFGGLCVFLQTQSVISASGLSMKGYLPGKIVQSQFSLLLATAAQWLLPQEERFFPAPVLLVCAACICILYGILCRKEKKDVAISKHLVYNEKNHPLRGNQYAVS